MLRCCLCRCPVNGELFKYNQYFFCSYSNSHLLSPLLQYSRFITNTNSMPAGYTHSKILLSCCCCHWLFLLVYLMWHAFFVPQRWMVLATELDRKWMGFVCSITTVGSQGQGLPSSLRYFLCFLRAVFVRVPFCSFQSAEELLRQNDPCNIHPAAALSSPPVALFVSQCCHLKH